MARKQKIDTPRAINPYPLHDRPDTKWYLKVGPPGCGKTGWVERQVENAARAYGPDLILLASFSNAAVAELAQRINLRWDQVATIHGHAYRAVNRPALTESPKERAIFNQYCADIGEDWAMLGEISKEVDAEELDDLIEPVTTDGPAAAIYSQYQILRAKMLPVEDWPEEVQDWHSIWNDYKYLVPEEHELAAERDKHGLWYASTPQRHDFADILDLALHTTTTAPGDPLVMIIDEGQDLSTHQMALVKHWGSKCLTVVLVGDPDQNLYHWAGTDPAAFWSLPAKPENITVLTQSFRVPQAVHSWAVQWINQVPNRRPVEYKPTQHTGFVTTTNATYENPGPILDQVEEWIEDPEYLQAAVYNNVPNGKPVAMLLTTCGYMLAPITAELRKRGIKYFNPYRIKQGAWQWPSYAGVRRLLAFLWNDIALFPGHTEIDPTVYDVWQWASLLEAGAFSKRGVKSHIESLNTDEATRNDRVSFKMLVDWLGDEGAWCVSSCDLNWLEGRIMDSKAKGMAGALAIAHQKGPHALLAPPQVIVGTMYSVKGGEAQNVVLFPDVSPAAERELGTDEGQAAMRRLVYVGATRANNGLILAARATSRAIQWGLDALESELEE